MVGNPFMPTVHNLGGGLASIDLPRDELVALGPALLARQTVPLEEGERPLRR
jgi:hypothetical protein